MPGHVLAGRIAHPRHSVTGYTAWACAWFLAGIVLVGCAFEPPSLSSCPVDDMPCTGLTWEESVTTSSAPDRIGGSRNGDSFNDLCASNAVLVGFMGAYGTDCLVNGVDGIARLEPQCAVATLDRDSGELVHGDQTALPMRGICDPSDTLMFGSLACPAGQVVSEVRGGDTPDRDNFANALEITCTPVRQIDGDLQLGTPEIVDGTIGPGNIDQTSTCPDGQIAVGVSGRFGQVIDRLVLECATVSPAP